MEFRPTIRTRAPPGGTSSISLGGEEPGTRSSVRVHAPPGGQSSINIGGSGGFESPQRDPTYHPQPGNPILARRAKSREVSGKVGDGAYTEYQQRHHAVVDPLSASAGPAPGGRDASPMDDKRMKQDEYRRELEQQMREKQQRQDDEKRRNRNADERTLREAREMDNPADVPAHIEEALPEPVQPVPVQQQPPPAAAPAYPQQMPQYPPMPPVAGQPGMPQYPPYYPMPYPMPYMPPVPYGRPPEGMPQYPLYPPAMPQQTPLPPQPEPVFHEFAAAEATPAAKRDASPYTGAPGSDLAANRARMLGGNLGNLIGGGEEDQRMSKQDEYRRELEEQMREKQKRKEEERRRDEEADSRERANAARTREWETERPKSPPIGANSGGDEVLIGGQDNEPQKQSEQEKFFSDLAQQVEAKKKQKEDELAAERRKEEADNERLERERIEMDAQYKREMAEMNGLVVEEEEEVERSDDDQPLPTAHSTQPPATAESRRHRHGRRHRRRYDLSSSSRSGSSDSDSDSDSEEDRRRRRRHRKKKDKDKGDGMSTLLEQMRRDLHEDQEAVKAQLARQEEMVTNVRVETAAANERLGEAQADLSQVRQKLEVRESVEQKAMDRVRRAAEFDAMKYGGVSGASRSQMLEDYPEPASTAGNLDAQQRRMLRVQAQSKGQKQRSVSPQVAPFPDDDAAYKSLASSSRFVYPDGHASVLQQSPPRRDRTPPPFGKIPRESARAVDSLATDVGTINLDAMNARNERRLGALGSNKPSDESEIEELLMKFLQRGPGEQ